MVGTRVRHYEIIEKIGEGGMGVVYLARDTSLDRKVALKFLPESSRDKATARGRFLREARAAAAIDHPYICKIYEAGEHQGQAFIGMEYVEGRTLQQRLREDPPPIKELLRIAVQAADALVTAHEKGFIHRDLKPSNIMLTPRGHVKIMDFGLAKRFGDDEDETTISQMTRPGTLLGTVSYMSPEQVNGRPADHRSDIFSLGVVLYEAAAGGNPFQRGATLQTLMAIANETPPPLRERRGDCPEGFAAIVARMLQKDRRDRYASAAELLGDLAALTEGSSPAHANAAPSRYGSIAVLPFSSIGAGDEEDYFSDGMTEEIITQLGKNAALKVISRTSVMRYKGTDRGIAAIGRELSVDAVLEGSVRRAADRVRISCTLFDVQSGERIWTETYDRRMTEIFALQTEVSRSIAKALAARVGSPEMRIPERKAAASIEAYHEFLKGRYYLNKLTQDDLQKAIAHFNAALDIDPVYSAAYAGLSTAYANAGYFGYASPQDPWPRAKAAAARALELDESVVEAHMSMALFLLLAEWDLDGAEAEFRRALSLNPNHAEARTLYSWYVAARGRLDEAVDEARRAVEIDPLSPLANVNLGWVLFYARRYEESIKQLETTLEIAPGFPHALMSLACSLLMLERHDEAIRIFEEHAFLRAQIAQACAKAGRQDRARAILGELVAEDGQAREPAMDIAWIHFFLGEADEGFRWLERACAQRDPRMIFIREFPPMAPYRSHPRMIEILGRAGLIP